MQGEFFCSECNGEYSIIWKAYSRFGIDEEDDLSEVDGDDDYPRFCPFCGCDAAPDSRDDELADDE